MFDCFIAVIFADSSFKIFIVIDSAVYAKLDKSLIFVYGSLILFANTENMRHSVFNGLNL